METENIEILLLMIAFLKFLNLLRLGLDDYKHEKKNKWIDRLRNENRELRAEVKYHKEANKKLLIK